MLSLKPSAAEHGCEPAGALCPRRALARLSVPLLIALLLSVCPAAPALASQEDGSLTAGSPAGATQPAASTGEAIDYEAMYRLYNPFTGEHFYTANKKERNRLAKKGWHYEGVGWMAPSAGDPVFRMYDKTSGDHHYTMSAKERNVLRKAGWKYEGVGWKSVDASDASRTALYRQYNRHAKTGAHNYTASASEQAKLVKSGWRKEGVAWYGKDVPDDFRDDMKPWYAHISGNAELDTQLDMILLDHKTLRSCYDYVASLSYRSGNSFTANPRILPDKKTIAYAKEMALRKSGNCYRFSSLFCWLARGLGYKANVVSGWVPSYSGGQAPHGWVEVYLKGKTYVCDPDMYEAIPDHNWYLVTYENAPVAYGSW